jgi:hypothetical protein
MPARPTYAFDVEGHTVVTKEKEPIKDKCPYCKQPMRWNDWKEHWYCSEHGTFDSGVL